ncbi:AI-2E family transporter [Brevibacillus parabrevis]|uniref:AI-2E family transporter n=1 Tax=Brevibacillus parabrevis TaxID=54914 RepID=UPI001C22E475|nr:AI-2E family transporter [Brevibacillus parabrevis]MBU8714854.1 AI-2E family transporter [Brevibacillus parabrevis]MED2253181.1 AI-2E family transporter [Brevibacillus parabrevis]WDV97176.1 AI-2E family transporter [Brevibacillus parabrevis]
MDELRRSRLFAAALWLIALLVIGNLLWMLRSVLAQLFALLEEVLIPIILGLVIAYLLHPVVQLLEKRRVPRLMAVLLIYASFVLVITIAVINAIPVFTNQLVELSDDLPRLMDWYYTWMSEWEAHKYFLPDSISHGVDRVIIQSQEGMSHSVTKLVNNARQSLGKLFAFAIVPFIAFYFLKDMKELHETGMSIVPKPYRKQVLVVLRDINESLGNYIHGQMIVALVVGVLAYLGYWLIGMPYPFVLAAVVCLTNIIPYIGPLIGAAPAIVVALTISTKMLLFVIAVNLVIQVLEGNILSPNIVGRSLQLHPLTIIVALLVGETIGGIIGLIVAVPVLAVCKVVISRIAVMMHES